MRMKRIGMREGRSALRKGLALVCAATLGGVASAATLHVDGASGADGNGGQDAASAKKTIQAAVDAATTGDVVLVAPGEYAAFDTQGKDITIRSTDGADRTKIRGGDRLMGLGYATAANLISDVVNSQIGDSEDDGGTYRYDVANEWRTWSPSDLPGSALEGFTVEVNSLPDGAYSLDGNAYAVVGGRVRRCQFVCADGLMGGFAHLNLSVAENCLFVSGALEDEVVADCILRNCTVYTGAYLCSSELLNTVVYARRNRMALDGYEGGLPRIANCVFWNVLGKESTDPLFVDAAHGDFRLRKGSPCINAGGAGLYALAEIDLAGNPRVASGRVDIGCYEYSVPKTSYGPFVVGDAVSISLSALVGYEAHGLPAGLVFDPGTGTISGMVTEKTDESGMTVTFTRSGDETFSMKFIVGPFPIRFEANGRSGEYNGAGYGISVSVSSPATGAVIEYAESESGPWSAEPIAYANVCADRSIWFRVTARGYETVTGSRKVTVTPRDIVHATIAPIDDQAFTGTDVKPVPTVMDGDPSIITTDDYDVSYADNVNIGTATLTLTGRGNYTGTKDVHFDIRRFDPRTVVFDALGGRIGSAGAVTQTWTRAYGDLPTAERAGYRLDGWFLGVTNGAPEAVGGATLLIDADHTLYARWSIDSAVSPDPESLCDWEMTAEGTARITGLGASAARLAKLILPDYVGGLPVTEIADGAFANTTCGVTELKIPLFCTKIGYRAFTGIGTLASVTFPAVVRDWQNPDSSSGLAIGDYAFAGTGLASVRLPESVTSIGNFAFANCQNLAEVTILGRPAVGMRPFRRAGIAVGAAPVVRIDPALAGDATYRDEILQGFADASVRTDAVVDGLSLMGLGVSEESVTVSVSVQRAADWGEVDISALRVDYRANLGDVPQELVPNRVERRPDGSLAVEVAVPGEASGFFRVKLVR